MPCGEWANPAGGVTCSRRRAGWKARAIDHKDSFGPKTEQVMT